VCGCEPTTCAAQKKNCGTISDSCGGLLPCGSCQSPQVCGGGGIANVCAAQQTPPSCQGGGQGAGHTCGSTDDDCCSSLTVKGGSYNRDNDASYPGLVSDFLLDRYLVTVGRFRAFLAAGQAVQASPPSDWSGGAPAIANSGWNPAWKTTLAASTPTLETFLRDGSQCNYGTTYGTWTNDASQADNNPINCVTWYEGMAFCAWDGGWLPTEEQLDYAQVGGSDQRAFPWSVPAASLTIDYSYANFENLSGAPNFPISVGSKSPKGDGRWGQTDLVGNEGEWTMDVWNTPYAATSCSDCAYLGSASTQRVVRSASWAEGWQESPFRKPGNEAARDSFVGFRCARLP
jgi:formylglycine-generating enzyme